MREELLDWLQSKVFLVCFNYSQPWLHLVDSKAQYTPPTTTTGLNCRVESRRRCIRNSQLAGGSLDESEQICRQ